MNKIFDSKKWFRIAAAVLVLLLAACSSEAPVVTIQPTTAVPLPAPTNTAIPIPASPTATPLSAPSSTATQIPASPTSLPPTLTYEESVHLFDYDRAVAFDIKEKSVTQSGDVSVHDITYAAHDPKYGSPAGRTSAYLVVPPGTGPFAGLVFMHWLGQTNGNRKEFLDEAITLAGQGVVSVLVDGVFPWIQPPTSAENDPKQVIGQVIELERALDLLLSQPGVDPARIGFVGHDYGAMFGSILAGMDHRPKAFVLMAGMGSFTDWSLQYWPITGSKGVAAYRQAMAAVDPIGYIQHAAPASLLFQFSQGDAFITKEAALKFYGAASDPKQIQWYDAPHSLNTDKDRQDRMDWLSSQLGLKVKK